MFQPLRIEVLERFAAVESFFKSTRKLGRHGDQPARGLVFVQIYAAYEYCVRGIVTEAGHCLISQGHSVQDLKPSLIGLFLHSELQSFKDTPSAVNWHLRTKIFETMFDLSTTDVGKMTFPNDNSGFKHKQLKMIFDIFTIDRIPVRLMRNMLKIDEVVEKRHAIAHGGETADQIGGRCSRADVRKTINQIKDICMILIGMMEKHCADPKNLCRKK